MKTVRDGTLPEHNPQDSAMIEVFASRVPSRRAIVETPAFLTDSAADCRMTC